MFGVPTSAFLLCLMAGLGPAMAQTPAQRPSEHFLLCEIYLRSASARLHRAAPTADPTIPYDIAALPSQ